MALKTKSALKKVFAGLSSIYIKKDGFATIGADMAFDFDMPVTVDQFNFSMAEPTLNRTKVHGLQADWCVTSTAGEVTVSFTVPSIHEDILTYFLGTGVAVSQSTIDGSTSTKYSGKEYALENTKLNMGIGLVSEDGNDMVLIKKLACYSTPLFENGSTTPFGFKVTGTIEASDTAGAKDIAFLTKVTG